MPNPFPGMDPYLEGDLWPTVHTDLCSEIARQLSPKLRPKYVALSSRRVVLAEPDETEIPGGVRMPDVGVLAAKPSNGGTATSVLIKPPVVVDVAFPEPISHISVEIRDVAQRRLVTCIEVLSLTNKRGSGLEEYQAKRLQICSGATHLVEVDLLRVGTRFPASVPLPPAPYYVFISRNERRKKAEVWPIQLEESLPSVPVPLLPEDADASLDLQQALSTIYDIFGYDELLNYDRQPHGPLTEQQAAWIDQRLRQAGRRK